MLRWHATSLLIIILATPALAADEAACEKFAWPLVRERTWFAAPDKPSISVGAQVSGVPKTAFVLRLASDTKASFAMPPEQKPKAETWFGGMVTFPSPDKPGLHQITLSEEAWIDVVQDGRYLQALAHTGRRDCSSVRKSVRFDVSQAPFVVQLSGAASDTVTLAVAPAE
jgi:hypothetical protein